MGREADRGRRNRGREGCLRCMMLGISGVSGRTELVIMREGKSDQNPREINDSLSTSWEDINEKDG